MILAKAASSIGTLGLAHSSLLMRSTHGKIRKGAVDRLIFIPFNTKACNLNGLRSVPFRSLSNLEEATSTLGSNSPRKYIRLLGFKSLLRGATTDPALSAP